MCNCGKKTRAIWSEAQARRREAPQALAAAAAPEPSISPELSGLFDGMEPLPDYVPQDWSNTQSNTER